MAYGKCYTVMTTSNRPGDTRRMARVRPATRSKGDAFWTMTDTSVIWCMDRKTADEICAKLGHNNPQVVGFDKACRIIEEQATTPHPTS